MLELVKDNLVQAQVKQKQWYYKNTRHQEFKEFKDGDQVLILLPTSTSKLMVSWQGPYGITTSVTYAERVEYANNGVPVDRRNE